MVHRGGRRVGRSGRLGLTYGYYWSCSRSVAKFCPTLCDPMNCISDRLLCLWNFPGRNSGVVFHFLLQGIFPTQGSKLRLLLGRWFLYHWATWEDHTLLMLCEKGMAAHSSILAWRIPWTEEPARLQPWCCTELDTAEQLTHKIDN